ncbi:MAG: hypothetical protein J1F02_12375 [Lachnospiraceae bacterium]|nr:hypothetical protein [Lachnospiraceae bacterium]
MKEIMKRAMALLLVMVMAFGVVQAAQGAAVQAANASETESVKAKKAYKKYLSNNKKENSKFALLDINKDGVSELITTNDNGYHVGIASYINGKVKTIGSGFSGSQEYYPDKHLYFSQTTHTGVDEYTYYKFTGKKLKVVARKYGDLGYNAVTGKRKPKGERGKSFKPYKYTVNRKKVSAKKYKAYVKELLSGAEKAELTWYKNTSQNRNKYL